MIVTSARDWTNVTPRPSFFGTLLLLLFLSFGGCAVAPPVQEMSDARQAINAAKEARADELAPAAFGNAKRHLEDATRQLEDRAYLEARTAALAAKEEAVRARDIAIVNQRGM